MCQTECSTTQSAATAAARSRTIARLLWSAQAEGLSIAPPSDEANQEDGLSLALAAVRSAVQASCQQNGWSFDNASWQTFVGEINNSLQNEELSIAWRNSSWKPWLLEAMMSTLPSLPSSSLWELTSKLEASSEEAQLLWEVNASFDGHLTHPCSKTKLELPPADLTRMAAEFRPRVPLLIGALAASASQQFVTPSCGAASASAYFALKFPRAHADWVAWLDYQLLLPQTGATVAASGTLNASDFVPLPLHPANLKHVLDDFAALIADRLLILPEEDAITLAAAAAAGPPPSSPPSSPPPAMLISAPLMSCRTLLPLASSAEGPDKRNGTEMEPQGAADGGAGGGGAGGGGVGALPPLAPYLKLPVPVQMTSLRRYLSPVEANGGPHLSAMLLEILRRDNFLRPRLLVLAEEASVHVHHPTVTYERARYLSCLYRANVDSLASGPSGEASGEASGGGLGRAGLGDGTRVMPLAALLSVDPTSMRPVLSHVLDAHAAANPAAAKTAAATAATTAALDWYASYCDVVLGSAVRLWLCYGVTLELHQQNTLLLLGSDGRLRSLICREVAGGAYCYEGLLQANGFDVRGRLHPRQDAIFDDVKLPLNILLHAIVSQHLLVLAEAVASISEGEAEGEAHLAPRRANHGETSATVDGVGRFGVAGGEEEADGAQACPSLRTQLVTMLRSAIRATLRACEEEHAPKLLEGEAHRAAFAQVLSATEHALLVSPTTRAKGLLHMRALGTKSELFTTAHNPLHIPPPANEIDSEIEAAADGRVRGADAAALSGLGVGRLEGFPLRWRALRGVEGVGLGWAQRASEPQ